MELILKITWTWYGEEPSLALPGTNVIGVNKRIIRLESYAFLCFNLLSGLQKNQSNELTDRHPTPPTTIIFPPKKRKKKRRKKDMPI